MQKECSVCKKKFFILSPSQYAWKYQRKYFCSRNCLKKYKEENKVQDYLRGESYKGS